MVTTSFLCLLAYLVGSIPSGYLLVRATCRLDVRDYGSHNVGAINVVRVGGLWLGLVTLLADIGKALGIVLLTAAVTPSVWTVASAAFLVMTGHAYSAWFLVQERRFSEGKSVACALGVLLGLVILGALPWWVVVAPVAVWVTGLLGPRLLTGRWFCISPATMAAAVAIPLAVWAAHPATAYLSLSVGMAVLILLRHPNNIRRLLAGTEPRLGDRVPLSATADARSPSP
ncbi:MAG: glycerol-3-phosphate acyltransferase [Armatimonadetes bacterium]|nr:glycerol-3-phosphate acyltransferase [Armatimonadota bacterium]